MRNLATIAVAASVCCPTWAQRLPVQCGSVPESSYARCLKEAVDRTDRAMCARLLEFDVKEIDDWQQCRQAEIEAEAAKQREAVAALASQSRAMLMVRVRTNATR